MNGINKCQTTGLLYINNILFTREHLKKLRKFFKYENKISNGQFKHKIVITDSNGGANVTLTADIIETVFKEYDVSQIASDKHFTM